MKEIKTPVKSVLFVLVISFCTISKGNATAGIQPVADTIVTSTQQQAIEFVDKITVLEPSFFWTNIKPALFLQNLKTNIHTPVSIYAGNATNFCGYGALTYLFLLDDPLGYAKIVLQLYREGKVSFANNDFQPSLSIKNVAGTLKFKGILDIHPADQMWFLTLADHFKGYLNFFNHKYDPGDEDGFWAAVNYAKFNRMVRKLLHYKIQAKGADLIRPHIGDTYKYISEKMKTGTVVLFINNRMVYRRNHRTFKPAFPTHYIVAEKISEENNIITFVYWDYGGKTLLQLSRNFFNKIIFGISYFTKEETYAK